MIDLIKYIFYISIILGIINYALLFLLKGKSYSIKFLNFGVWFGYMLFICDQINLLDGIGVYFSTIFLLYEMNIFVFIFALLFGLIFFAFISFISISWFVIIPPTIFTSFTIGSFRSLFYNKSTSKY